MGEEDDALLERALARINADPAHFGPRYQPWSGQEADGLIAEQRRLEAGIANPRTLAAERRRLKTAAKLYKAGPKKTGRERLEAKVRKLCVEAVRWSEKGLTPEDRAWCERVAAALKAV